MSEKRGKFGLIGEKLGHSYSPEIHARLADYDYELREVPPEELSRFLTETDFGGMNVTIPYKKTVIKYCTALSGEAKRMGAVNTMLHCSDGWHGYNTDYYGFRALVIHSGIDVGGKKALVFGSGGASGAVCPALTDLGVSDLVIITRNGEDNYQNLAKHYDAQIIVNTTPLGMYPHCGASPADLRHFPLLEGVFDVVYNPARTALLLQAEELGIPHAGGLYMLVAQAKRSAEIFTGRDIADSSISEIVSDLHREMMNIVIIGMPGAGKSSVANEISRLSGRELIETDAEIVKEAGMSIPEFFTLFGEEAFRKLETAVIERVCALSGRVISTGGGVVTREENYPLLHQNSRIVLLKRDLGLLPVAGRPISQARSAEDIYEERREAYERFADFTVENDTTIEEAARKILAR